MLKHDPNRIYSTYQPDFGLSTESSWIFFWTAGEGIYFLQPQPVTWNSRINLHFILNSWHLEVSVSRRCRSTTQRSGESLATALLARSWAAWYDAHVPHLNVGPLGLMFIYKFMDYVSVEFKLLDFLKFKCTCNMQHVILGISSPAESWMKKERFP